MRLPPLLLVVLCMVTACALVLPASAAPRVEHVPAHDKLDPNDYGLFGLFGGDLDIVDATIIAVQDSAATYSNPPRVTIKVHEVLRGRRPPGIQEIRWMPPPGPGVYCGNELIGRAQLPNQTRMNGPEVGIRMILAGQPIWSYQSWCSWESHRKPYSDSLRAEMRRNARLWSSENLKLWLTDERNARSDRSGYVRSALHRAEKQAREDSLESAWRKSEQALARSADIRALVRSSDAVLVGEFPRRKKPSTWFPEPPILNQAPRGSLRVLEWIRATQSSESDSLIGLSLGQSEISTKLRWEAHWADHFGFGPSASPRLIAFLRLTSNTSDREKMQNYRPTDPNHGLLLADEAMVARVRHEVARGR